MGKKRNVYFLMHHMCCGCVGEKLCPNIMDQLHAVRPRWKSLELLKLRLMMVVGEDCLGSSCNF